MPCKLARGSAKTQSQRKYGFESRWGHYLKYLRLHEFPAISGNSCVCWKGAEAACAGGTSRTRPQSSARPRGNVGLVFAQDGVEEPRSPSRMHYRPQSVLVAIAAPSPRALSLAQTMRGSGMAALSSLPKPQFTPAITFSRPTTPA